jgi:DNA-binding NarL/FixJ family response regulator
VAVTGTLDRRALRDLLGAGVDGIVLERQLEACLALAVRAARSGQLVLPGEFRPQVAKPRLSPRERQILALVVIGFTNGEIAQKLFVTETTVKSHLSSAFAKLGVRSRTEATDLILDPESGLGTGILAISDGEAAPIASPAPETVP